MTVRAFIAQMTHEGLKLGPPAPTDKLSGPGMALG